MLAAIGWWADLINDQVLRSDVYVRRRACRPLLLRLGRVLFRQVARCARAHLISAQVEQDQPQLADRLADNLVRLYPATRPAGRRGLAAAVALREIRLEPRSWTGIAQLATRATVQAGAAADREPA